MFSVLNPVEEDFAQMHQNRCISENQNNHNVLTQIKMYIYWSFDDTPPAKSV